MKIKILCFAVLVVLSGSLSADSCTEPCHDNIRIKKFPIAVLCRTFSQFSFLETIDIVRDLGINFLEICPGQKLTSDPDDQTHFDIDMTDSQVQWVKEQLRKRDISLVSFGIVRLNNEENGRKIFEFCKKFDIRIIVTEPVSLDLSLTERLVKQYNMQAVVHNWNPDTLHAAIKGLDPRIGACADPGHWMHSGICPVTTIHKLNRRVRHVYLNDLNEPGAKTASDVPPDNVRINIHDILTELTLQDYDGYLLLDLETGKDVKLLSQSITKNMDTIRSNTYFKDYVQLLSRWEGKYNLHGWNHYGPGYFLLDEKTGILKGQEGMGLLWYSVKKFNNFMLELDFMSEDYITNSGIFLRIPDMPASDDYIYQCYEIQIDNSQRGIHQTGAVYDALAPTSLPFFEPGEWNHYRIIFQKMHLRVELNDVIIVDWDAEPRGKVRSLSDEGYIGLQNHDSRAPVYFRNIFIKEL